MTKLNLKLPAILGLALLLLGFVPIVEAQQNARLQIDHLDKLFPNAVETVDVQLEGALLQVASKFLSNKPEEAAIKDLISSLKGVYVKGAEFDSDGQINEADIDVVRTQLRSPGWERIVGVRSKRQGENVEVYLMMDAGIISGVGVLVYAPKELYVVNVVGPIDPEKISQLRGHFGVPKDLDFDIGGSRRNR